MTDARSRMPVIVLDYHGYDFYRDLQGRHFLPADRYAVRLVTDISKIDQAKAPGLDAVVGVQGDAGYGHDAYAHAVRFLYSLGGQPAARLVAIGERLLLAAATLREELGLPGPPVAETTRLRDKVAMKQHLSAAGIRVPDFAPFSEAAARALLRAHPALVIKPRLGAGTKGLAIVRDPAELAALTASLAVNPDDFEVEEYIDGPLFHVDSVVREGKVVAATAGRYLDETSCYAASRPCRSVAVADGPLLDELLDFNQRVISCYQRFTGVTHHEMFVTSDGCCLCEIAARAGGAGVSAGFWSRTGVDLGRVVVQAQTQDRVPAAIEMARHLTGWVLIHGGPGMLLDPIVIPDEPWVVDARVRAQPGDVLPGPAYCGDYVALATVRGDTEAEVSSRLDEVVKAAAPKVSPG
jgi:ATP-grasp domain-containing protein